MMRHLYTVLFLFLSLLVANASAAAGSEGRIYGKVITQDGAVYEGLIRWDKNEASWLDVLNGSKTMEYTERNGQREQAEVRILGVRISYERDAPRRTTRDSGIRFGHLRSLENVGRDRALLTLRGGQQIELHGGSSDIGRDIREIIVEDRRRGQVELEWRDIDRIEFGASPPGLTSRFGERLYGTLTTRSGAAFTGYICWDVDEVLAEDVLDGKDERGRNRDIRFAEIASIERESSSRARVILRNGEKTVLRGTNDVNDDNRGILVLDPALGQVQVRWNEFDRVVFGPPRAPIHYEEFPGEGPLRGTITTRDGQKYTGLIRWDDDEAFAWELLDGNADGIEYDVEFGFVRAIERLSSSSARVTLRDGRSLDLRDSNDVNDENNGIFVTLADGDVVEVTWREFRHAAFEKP